jgi:beta-1,4-mannosyltransferase
MADTTLTTTSTPIPSLSPDRPALLISSTSWTADEDFSLLLTALDIYQSALQDDIGLPRLLVIITGLGELRAPFERIVAQRELTRWKGITVRCVFVAARDYPTLLGCADLGLSLHSSSSGRDLPMKVVDMFGCGVPVLARNFECIGELVKDKFNGRVFADGEELGLQMIVSIAVVCGWWLVEVSFGGQAE